MNEQKNIKKQTSQRKVTNDINKQNQHLYNNADEVEDIQKDVKNKKMISNKIFKRFGIILLIFGIIASYIVGSEPTVDTSVAASDALVSQISTSLSIGTILLSNDETLANQNHEIIHQTSDDETVIWVWDYAAEDGDYVQVYANGKKITEVFMIKHKPVKVIVPSTGEVQIKGIRDGGGGITYAVHYEINGTTYFNTAPEGGENTYTLIRD